MAQPVTFLGVVMIVSVVMITTYLVRKDTQDAISDAVRSGDNLTLLLEQHLVRTLKNADQVLLSLRKSYLADPTHFDLAAWTKNVGAIDDAMLQVGLVGADGYLIATSAGPLQARVGVADREEFFVQARSARDELFVGAPTKLRSSGKWSINLTRRITLPDGTFAGVVSASLDPTQLVRVYSSIDLGELGLSSIVGLDGRIRIRRSGNGNVTDGSFGRQIPDLGLFEAVQKTRVGHYWATSARDGLTRRLLNYRVLDDYPLVVVVGRSEAVIFQNHLENARIYLGIDGVLFFAISVAMGIGAIRQRKLLLTQSELEQARETLHIQNERFKSALENMPQGLAMFDADRRLVICNTRYAQIYGHPPEEVRSGTPMSQILESRLARNVYAEPDKPEVLRRQYSGVMQDIHDTRPLNSGRIIAVSVKPIMGGWVSTHADVTEAKHREESFRLLFENNPIPMWVADTKTLGFLAVNDAAVAHYGYSREQFLAMTVLEIRPERDREQFVEFVRVTGGIHDGERTRCHVTASGEEIDVAIYTHPLNYQGREAALVAAVDITDRKRAEEEVRNTKAFLDTLIENVPVPITVKEAQRFQYVLVNRAAEALLGCSRDQIMGKKAHDLFPQDMADEVLARDREVLHSGQVMLAERTEFHTPGNGIRNVRSRRIAIPGAGGKSQYLLGVLEDITEQKRSEAQVVYMARHDALTGLANRMLLTERLEEAVMECRRYGERFAVHLLDLDHFKEVNDSLGHPVGDALLKEVAERLRACIRETETVARLGGDEFAILQKMKNEPRESAIVLASRILESVVAPYVIDGQKITVGTSIGIALAPDHGDKADLLLKNADLALYKVKAEGRNGFRFFEAELEAVANARRALKNDLRDALAQEEFEIHYQAIVDVASRQTVGMEALVRWRHPLDGIILSDEFIPLAEETGLIVPIGEWVLRTACATAARWPAEIKLAVNLSPAQFKKSNLVEVVVGALADSGLPPDRLELEITESVLLHENEENLAVLHRLRDVGVAIVLDDFGTGYSSLSYLRMFPFDKIKIDRSFVNEMSTRADCAAIVCAVAGMAKSLDMVAAAEGVENEEQFHLLRAAGCNQVQGYLFRRPVPASELAFGSAGAAREEAKVA